MTTCETLSERMPDVAWGRDAFGDDDRAHLAACGQCRAEWALVEEGVRLERGVAIDGDRMAERVLGRLAAERPVVRRLPWRGVGLAVAAAASIALVVWVPRPRPGHRVASVERTAAANLLPELERLDENELRQVLVTVEGNDAADVSPAALPRLGDLTEAELEQVLRELGG